MQLQGKALRVTIYIGESDRYQGQALYMTLLELLRREGASGATITRGLAGFGAHSRIHTATIVTLSEDLPVRLEWVDPRERVERLLPQVRRLVDDGLITVEEVEVVQYAAGRRPEPLDQPIHQAMRREVVTVSPDMPVARVVELLLQRGYRSLPVVDADGRLLGIITDGDLLRRTSLATRLDLLAELSPADLRQQLIQLQQAAATAASVMTRPLVTVTEGDPVRLAMTRMVEHRLKRLPVLDEAGRLTGWISRVDLLRLVEYHQVGDAKATAPLLPEEQPRRGQTVAELMYRDVPTVPPAASLAEIIHVLEASRRRRAVVVDEQQRVLGILTDGDLLRSSRYPGLFDRLRRLLTGQPASATLPLPEAGETAATLMTAPAITIAVTTSLAEALSVMLRHQIKRLPVVDESGRLVGLLGRASLLQGLLEGP